MQTITFDDIQEQEKEFFANNYREVHYDEGEKTYKVLQGKRKILLSAPHAVCRIKEDGTVGDADTYTGSLLKMLQKQLDVHAIYASKSCLDPNRPMNTEYRKAVLDIVKEHDINLLIELHSLAKDKTVDIDFCTNYGENIKGHEYVKDILEKNFIENSLDKLGDNKYFHAPSFTICGSTSKEAGIPCIQLEINGKNLRAVFINENKEFENDYQAVENFNKVFKAIKESIEEICEY